MEPEWHDHQDKCSVLWWGLDFTSIPYPITHDINIIIQSTFIPTSTSVEEKLIWNLNCNGMFSTKSVYSFIDALMNNGTYHEDHYSWNWKLKTPIRLNYLYG